MTENTASSHPAPKAHSRFLPEWEVAELPRPPFAGWKLWVGLLGPGVVLAGTSIGTGEWLFGPAVTAQYGASVMWLASISIVFQVFANLIFMRYALASGEPIVVGILRAYPGPKFWICILALLEFFAIWPYNASNAAVPLSAAFLGRLPGPEDTNFVNGLGITIFLGSFVPLIFGGTVYRMLEWIMSVKLVVVLLFCGIICIFTVSGHTAMQVIKGFFGFGTLPLRAEVLVVGDHFNIARDVDGVKHKLSGSFRDGKLDFVVLEIGDVGVSQKYKTEEKVPAEARATYDAMLEFARATSVPGTFHLYTAREGSELTIKGVIDEGRLWQPQSIVVATDGTSNTYTAIDQVPESVRPRVVDLMENNGAELTNIVSYYQKHGELPPLDWAMIAAFVGIAGAGGMSNTLFSNYCRDKGWGMGKHVGAIPSAVGGRNIALSHVGKTFELTDENRHRWHGWLRHVIRDQTAVWMLCSFIGMALPCMISLEFIRNHTVEGQRVAAMTAEGLAARYPNSSAFLWFITLFTGFLVLAPGQVSVGDQIARRWTDIIWTFSKRLRTFKGNQVKFLYYGILTVYAIWGLGVLIVVKNPLNLAKIGAVVGNASLGFSALIALYLNRTMLARELRPKWFLQLGVLGCVIFFLGMATTVFVLFFL
jgi:hypothetical protein